jgi:hypothetical protein
LTSDFFQRPIRPRLNVELPLFSVPYFSVSHFLSGR